MKLIMENWNKFLVEAELGGDGDLKKPTTTGEVPAPTEDQVEAVEDLLKTIVALASAVEDADEEIKETAKEIGNSLGEGSARRMGRAASRDHNQKIKKIKDMAGLAGIKIEDFTPEERQLYDQAKQEVKNMEDAWGFNFINTLVNGNLLDIPIIKKLVDIGGSPLKTAITAVLAVAGASQCMDELTLACLTNSLHSAGQGQ